MSQRMLEIEKLKTYYDTTYGVVKAVDEADIEVDKGEIVGLVGESGCGKSTLVYSIIRLFPSKICRIISGKITFLGESMIEKSDDDIRRVRGSKISMVFQDPKTYFNPVMKIGNQIGEAISLYQGLNKAEREEKVIEVLNRVYMPSPEKFAKNYPHQLSGGMLQRAMIAMAISCNPVLLIADEPTTALDVTLQAGILDLLKELREKTGTSIILITHDLGIISEICDVVYVMYAGKTVESGDIFSLFNDPKHPYTIGLLNSALSIEQFKKNIVTIKGTVPNLIDPPSGCRFHPRCPKAKQICHKQEPPTYEVGLGARAHKVSCWLYEG